MIGFLPQTYEKILAFAQRGGIVIATRRLPAHFARALNHAAEISARIQSLSETLFHGQIATAHFVADEHQLGRELAGWMHPDFITTPATPEIGFFHRHLDSGDLYFIANTSNRRRSFHAAFRSATGHAELWDAFSGTFSGISDPTNVGFDLQPYESRLIFFSSGPVSRAPSGTSQQTKTIDLSHDWDVTFEGHGQAQIQSRTMHDLSSWIDDPVLRFYSGRATYRKAIEIPASSLGKEHSFAIDFGEGTPVPMPETTGRIQHARLSRKSIA